VASSAVEQWFAQGRANPDDKGEGRLMPTVEMISVLCDWCRGGPPAIRMVAPRPYRPNLRPA
jgi:hypothetical protein